MFNTLPMGNSHSKQQADRAPNEAPDIFPNNK